MRSNRPEQAATSGLDGVEPALGLVNVLGVTLHDLTSEELNRRLLRHGGVLFTPNVDIIMKARRDPEFGRVLEQADYRVCDSRIVQWACAMLGTPVREKISGSDFFAVFCEHNRDNEAVSIYLLGAAPGVAAEAMRRINARIGRRIVVAAHSPSFGFEQSEEESEAIARAVHASGATVLAVGVGAPKQEKWIMRHRVAMPAVKIFMGIGATLDFEAGNVRRAPGWVSASGLEWAWRLASEPRRLWRRYLVDDMPFFWLVLRQRLGFSVSAGPQST